MKRNESSSDPELVGVDPHLAALARLIKSRDNDGAGGVETSTVTKRPKQQGNPFNVLSASDRKKMLHSKLARDISKYSAAADLEDDDDLDVHLKASGGWGARAPAFTPSDLGSDWKRRHQRLGGGGDDEDASSTPSGCGADSPLDDDAPQDETLHQKQARRRANAELFLGGGGSKSRAKAARSATPLTDDNNDDPTPWRISASNLNAGGPVGSSSKNKKMTRDIPKELNHKYTHLLVIDFEATCDAAEPEYPHEIIEFPCVAVEMETGCIVSEFQTFVRPTLNPILTEFCTVLTGIRQEDVDAAPLLPQAVLMFRAWLDALEKDWVSIGSIANVTVDKKDKHAAAAGSMEASAVEGDDDAVLATAAGPSPAVGAAAASSCIGSINTTPLVYMQPPLKPGQVMTGDAAKLRADVFNTFMAALEASSREESSSSHKGGKKKVPLKQQSQVSTNGQERRFLPAIGTDGPWDMRKFMHECSVLRDGTSFPELFYSWVDIRRNFSDFHKKRLMKLTHMLRFLGLSFIGERHRGIDDARNIARVAMSLVRKGYKFRQVCQIPFLAEGSIDLAQQRLLSDLLQDEVSKKGGGGGMGSKTPTSGSNTTAATKASGGGGGNGASNKNTGGSKSGKDKNNNKNSKSSSKSNQKSKKK